MQLSVGVQFSFATQSSSAVSRPRRAAMQVVCGQKMKTPNYIKYSVDVQARLRAMEALDAKKAIEKQLKQVGEEIFPRSIDPESKPPAGTDNKTSGLANRA